MIKRLYRNVLIVGIILGALMLAGQFATYPGGWEVTAYASQARVDSANWVDTDPAEWEYDFDARYSGAANLYFHIGGDPYHVNEYYQPSPVDQPIETITKETETRKYQYDYHIYAMDITLQAKAQFLVEDDPFSNSITSETSYSKDRPGDGGSHLYQVRFVFEIAQWEKFAGERDSWAGIMSVNLYKNPEVGYQEVQHSQLKNLRYVDETNYGQTQVEHDARPPQAGKLNTWTETGSFVYYGNAAEVAPSARIPQKVIFQLGAEFRSGALLGKDGLGLVEDIFPLDPFVIFHISFGVLTIHEYYLESERQVITQTSPASPGVPDTSLTGPFWEKLGRFLEDLWPFGGLQGLIVFVVLAAMVILLAPYITSAFLGRKLSR